MNRSSSHRFVERAFFRRALRSGHEGIFRIVDDALQAVDGELPIAPLDALPSAGKKIQDRGGGLKQHTGPSALRLVRVADQRWVDAAFQP